MNGIHLGDSNMKSNLVNDRMLFMVSMQTFLNQMASSINQLDVVQEYDWQDQGEKSLKFFSL